MPGDPPAGAVMRGRNLKKLLDAINLLTQPCGTTISELSSRLTIDRRQAYRVIETLQDEFCFVVERDKTEAGGVRFFLSKDQYRLLSNMKVADINLSPSEVIALHFLKGHAGVYKGTGIEVEIHRAFEKLAAFIPARAADRLGKINDLVTPFSKFTKNYAGKEEIIQTLTGSILQQKTCSVDYHSFRDDKLKVIDVDPLTFFEHHGGLYLFARLTSVGEVRMLAVERIGRVTPTEDTFTAPVDFHPEELLDEAFDLIYDDPVTVTIRFSQSQARYIRERRWAKEQKIMEHPGGCIIFEMKTSGWGSVKRWVLGFGRDAEVIEPIKMRNEIADDLLATLESYR